MDTEYVERQAFVSIEQSTSVNIDGCIEDVYNEIAPTTEDGGVDVFDMENEEYDGDKDKIPSCIKIDADTEIDVNFRTTTSDNTSADQEIAECLIDALFDALKCASDDDFDISSIYIYRQQQMDSILLRVTILKLWQ